MSDLLIRNITLHLKRQIAERARARGHSLSEEAKELLQQALLQPAERRGLGTEMFDMIRPEDRGDDIAAEFPDDFPDPPDLK
jgi:plasmid stability protein